MFSVTIAYIFFAIYSSTFHFASAQLQPNIVQTSDQQIKELGDTLKLECSLQHAENYPVWLKLNADNPANPLIISSGTELLVKDRRFSVNFFLVNPRYNLQIKELEATDAGTYQCQITLADKSRIASDVKVFVRSPPLFSDNSTSSAVVREGDNVTLECYASGFPRPTVIWKREEYYFLQNGEKTYQGNILEISQITREDKGNYYCVAGNNVTQGVTRNVSVEVQFAPEVAVNRPQVGQALYHEARLDCHIKAFPRLTITWLKNNEPLINNEPHELYHRETTDEWNDIAVFLVKIEKRDFGNYTCRATNGVGTSEGQVELIETPEPENNYPTVSGNLPDELLGQSA